MMENLAGTELSEAEAKLVDVYRELHRIVDMCADELPPFALRNATKALSSLWQVMNGLDMDPGQLYDLGA
ncbi:MAG TPA: hypothetical protein VGB19_00745 [Actinomycetota bacterium]